MPLIGQGWQKADEFRKSKVYLCQLLDGIPRHMLRWTRGFTLLYKHAIAEIQLYYTSKHYGSTT